MVIALAGIACAADQQPTGPSATTPPTGGPPIRVLMLTATAGLRHDSIAAARQVMAGPTTRGRAYYNALGHFDATWTDPRFQRQLIEAIRWVAQRN